MVDDIRKYVDILCELDITEHQFLILWLVSTKDEQTIARYRASKDQFKIDEITDLVDRGLLEDFGTIHNGVKSFNIYDFLVTDKFQKEVVIDKDDAIEELIAVYPSWFVIQGKKWPAKTFDIDALGKLYFPAHKGNKAKHEKIVQITKDYHEKITNGVAQKKIEDYIRGRLWILFEEALNENKGGDIGFTTY